MKSFIYILTNKNKTVLYTGVTNDLVRRIFEHKSSLIKGFTNKYNVDRLIYYEQYTDIETAIKREKQIKKWKRQWKENVINAVNPEWNDLYGEICL